MKAIYGGKAKNDKIDSRKIAGLLRGGMFPMAYDYQAEMRATRDLLRRRTYMTRRRADLLSHIQNTNSQYNQPAFPFHIERKCRREEVLSHFTDPDVLMSINTDFNLVDQFTLQIGAMESYILENARLHNPESLYLLRTIHGVGKILSMTILYEIGDINRFPAVMFLKGNPEGREYRARIQRKHGKAKSLSILAHKLGRTTYYMLKRKKPFDMNKFLSA